jgi:hypothetical protein
MVAHAMPWCGCGSSVNQAERRTELWCASDKAALRRCGLALQTVWKADMRHRPCFLRKAPGTPVFPMSPGIKRGGRSAERRTNPCSRLERSAGAQTNPGVLRALIKRARLSALHRGVCSVPGRASRGDLRLRQRAPRSQALVPGGRCPGTARVHRVTLAPRPQAPHPILAGISPARTSERLTGLSPVTPSARSASERLRRRPSRARTRIIYP